MEIVPTIFLFASVFTIGIVCAYMALGDVFIVSLKFIRCFNDKNDKKISHIEFFKLFVALTCLFIMFKLERVADSLYIFFAPVNLYVFVFYWPLPQIYKRFNKASNQEIKADEK